MHVNILGIRGIPAAHGGFETFASVLAPYLVERGHHVLVYCQAETGPPCHWTQDQWQGIERRHFRPKRQGPLGTMEFDLACVRDVLARPGVDLVLGYNTAVFNLLQRLFGRRIVMNMDGIEWRRSKWSLPARVWFFLNEVLGANLASALIADHPGIAAHIARRSFRRPVVIPYGADAIKSADVKILEQWDINPDAYLLSVARIEPENSILELVQAFNQTPGTAKYVILGNFEPTKAYHREIRNAAGPRVVFAGPIYERTALNALRFHCRAYLHGHRVGGTNPSLVEALGAANAVIAHDNGFNRWVAGDAQFYFGSMRDCSGQMRRVFSDNDAVLHARCAARKQHRDKFGWGDVLAAYEHVLCDKRPKAPSEQQGSERGIWR